MTRSSIARLPRPGMAMVGQRVTNGRAAFHGPPPQRIPGKEGVRSWAGMAFRNNGRMRTLLPVGIPSNASQPAVDSVVFGVATLLRVPVDGASKHELEATVYVLAEMGFDDLQVASGQEASNGRLVPKGPALIVTVPDDIPARFVLQLVDHALRDLRLFPRLVAGRPVIVSGT